MTVWFEGDALSKWEGDYFEEDNSELARTMSQVRQPGQGQEEEVGR